MKDDEDENWHYGDKEEEDEDGENQNEGQNTAAITRPSSGWPSIYCPSRPLMLSMGKVPDGFCRSEAQSSERDLCCIGLDLAPIPLREMRLFYLLRHSLCGYILEKEQPSTNTPGNCVPCSIGFQLQRVFSHLPFVAALQTHHQPHREQQKKIIPPPSVSKMHLLTFLLPTLPTSTLAQTNMKPETCIFAHTYRQSCRPDGEHMYIDAYAQTGDLCCQQVCLGIIRRTFDHGGAWRFDHTNGCERGYVLDVSENGTSVRFEGPDGYVADLVVPRAGGNASSSTSMSRGMVCSETSLGYQYESCLYDAASSPGCNYCPWCGLDWRCLGNSGLPGLGF